MLHVSGWSVVLLAAVSGGPGQLAAHSQDSAVAVRSGSALPQGSRQASGESVASRPAQVHKSEVIEHDFGQAWAGDAVKHTFELTNASDHVLEIRSVTTTCGCTTTSKWEKQVEPGHVWNLEVSLATASRKGSIRKTVTVKTDDTVRSEILLVLKGEIQPRFEFSPAESVAFGALQAGTVTQRTLTITNKLAEPVVFTQTTPTSKCVRATLREIDKGQRYELNVQTVPPLPEAGSLGTITLETDLKEQPKVTVPVYGTVRPRVCLSPKTISVPVPTSNDVHRSIQLMTIEGKKPQILDVETSNLAVAAIVETSPADQAERIRVTIPKGTELPAKGETITVYTDDPEFPKLICELRSYQFTRAGASRPAGSESAMRRQRQTMRPPTTAPASRFASSQPSQVQR